MRLFHQNKKTELADQKPARSSKKSEKHKYRITPDLLNYKRLLHDNILLMKDDSVTAWYQIRGKGVFLLNDQQQNNLVGATDYMYSIYTGDMKFIFSTHPVDTSAQQTYWAAKAEKYQELVAQTTTDSETQKKYQLYAQLCDQKYTVLKNIGLKKNNEDYTLVIFGKNEEELNKNSALLESIAENVLDLVPKTSQEVQDKLNQLNNMNYKF